MTRSTCPRYGNTGAVPRHAGCVTTMLLGALIIAGCSSPPPAEASSNSRELPYVAAPHLPALGLRADGVQVCPLQTGYLFDNGSAVLRPSAERLLERCLEPVLRAARSGRSIHVVGYADGVGDAEANLVLSSRRSSQVAGWLAARGVPSTELRPEGRGERSAIDAVPDPEQRRVLVEIGP